MSGIVSGIGKVFSTVTSGVARVGKAIMGVGATTFTAGAATGAAPLASGGLAGIVQKFTGTSTLGNILTGAITQAGNGALIGGAVSAMTGGSFGKGALIGGLGGAVSGGLFGAAGLNPDPLTRGFARPPGVDSGITTASTTTGVAPTGATAPAPTSVPSRIPRVTVNGEGAAGIGANGAAAVPMGPGSQVVAAGQPQQNGFFSRLLNSEAGGGLIAGLGQGLMQGKAVKDQIEAQKEAAEADRQFLRDKDQRLQDSYDVDPAVYHGTVVDGTQRPTPARRFGRRYEYDPNSGRIVQVAG